MEKEEPDFDIGCIHLDQDKGNEVGWFAIGALPAEELVSYLANVAGYPADRGRRRVVSRQEPGAKGQRTPLVL